MGKESSVGESQIAYLKSWSVECLLGIFT